MRFEDRDDAGRRLAAVVREHLHDDIVVFALPRGGVPVAARVAEALGAPLDVLCVRKLGLPAHPELAMGAIAEGGVRVIDHDLVRRLGVDDRAIRQVEMRERVELERQAACYRAGRAPLPLDGRTAVIVDDGLATGTTAQAAARTVRARGARKVLLAVPVGARDSMDPQRLGVDEIVAVIAPRSFGAVGAWYDDFGPTSDAEVISALASASHPVSDSGAASDFEAQSAGPSSVPEVGDPSGRDCAAVRSAVRIPAADVTLDGWLDVPLPVRGVVVFVHGSGSSRNSRRNQAVASHLNRRGFATLLFDLLTDAEADDRRLVFDIPLLTQRLHRALDWLSTRPELSGAPVGLFGASTGAAAALQAAAAPDSTVEAVVSRGGRPDLAMAALGAVRCPVLLIVGGVDHPTVLANEAASARIHAPHLIEIVPGAGHLFSEPGALDRVAGLATSWFDRHLATAARPIVKARGSINRCAGRPRR